MVLDLFFVFVAMHACVQVLKCLALLGKGSQEATDAMTDILAKVAAAHTTAQAKAGRVARTTAGAVAMEAANTIMAVEPVPRLRSYAVQIMANFLKLSDNNMRCVPPAVTLIYCYRCVGAPHPVLHDVRSCLSQSVGVVKIVTICTSFTTEKG